VSADPKELYSLLIPLRNERLLVPRMCVAEVIAFADAARSRDDAAPDWYLGAIEWNNRRLPVVTFDAQQGDERKSKRTRTRCSISASDWGTPDARRCSVIVCRRSSSRKGRSASVAGRSWSWASRCMHVRTAGLAPLRQPSL